MDILFGIAIISFLAAVFLFIFFMYWGAGRKKLPPVAGAEKNSLPEGKRGDARTCPICAARFENGETVRSKRFPSTGRFDRLLHISGCPFCSKGERKRLCPVCKAELSADDYLVARIYERPGKSHVHVQGCVHCLVGSFGNSRQ